MVVVDIFQSVTGGIKSVQDELKKIKFFASAATQLHVEKYLAHFPAHSLMVYPCPPHSGPTKNLFLST
jgi:hypothetical protein